MKVPTLSSLDRNSSLAMSDKLGGFVGLHNKLDQVGLVCESVASVVGPCTVPVKTSGPASSHSGIAGCQSAA